ncbi:acylating sulfoacetaldehyde dehydrogenase [Halococcus hamelinensis]|uniref:Acetaldehyde dehydrogenase n=1 Tax=Halococcus hamelinensis 100A6 TaxID=1132509 RepID=M0LVV1_9EURY|nr:aldehyde dehydrogenase family protein [Halococcus hamelinensis]EMA37576.1 acetaldehyde dehydrogenase [Halococcus hamelinensis 100A6]
MSLQKNTSTDHEPTVIVSELIENAEAAMAAIDDYDQERTDELVQAVGWAIYPEKRAREISEVAVETTGLGNVEDKISKKQRKTKGTLSDVLGKPSVGVIDRDEEAGLVEIAKPVGVVGAVVPSTNPGATPGNLAMMALKGRNAIVLSPSPGGVETCELVVEYIHEELEKVGAPTDLVQMVPRPINKATTYELMEQVDLLQVTGSGSNVEHGEESGTPNYCVGEGNAVSVVDSTANLPAAANRIQESKTFDYATSCSSDNSAVVVESVHEDFLAALEAEGGYVCSDEERAKLESTMFPEGHGSLSGEVVGQPPADIAAAADLGEEAQDASFFVVEGEGVGSDYPLSGEKISVVLTVYEAPDFDSALDRTSDILDFEGTGHSCGLHTTDDDHAERIGHEIDVARLLINQPQCYGNGGNFDNGLEFTLSMGAGTWGGNQTDENINYTHFLNTTTVSRPLSEEVPSDEAVFGSYLERYGR